MSGTPVSVHSPRVRGAHPSFVDLGPEPPFQVGKFKSFDGEELFYCDEGQGKPLVFCYGLVCSSLHWTYQIDVLSRHYRCIWFDYRGHGHNPPPREINTLTLANCAKDLQALLQFLKVEEAVVFGHSMGVNVALHLWEQDPKRVRGFVLANGTVKPPFEAMGGADAMSSAFRLLRSAHQKTPGILSKVWKFSRNNKLLKTAVALGGFNPSLIAWDDVQSYLNQITEMDPEIFLQLAADFAKRDQSRTAANVKVPTLILAGEKDSLVPIDRQELMRQLIEGSSLEIIRHASHCPQLELPEQVTLVIQSYLNKIHW